MTTLSNEEIRRYSRHLIMPEFGMEGQRRLKESSVLLIFQAGRTSRERGRQARQILEKVKANIVGVVLNNAQVEPGYGYYG